MKKQRIVYMGTPIFAQQVLETIVDNGYNVVGVVTQPDKPVGRKKEIVFSPVKKYANEKGILCIQPNPIKTDYQSIIDLEPDIIVTCAYGQIVPDIILNYPKYGCLNIHASLLPKLRGGAPIHKSIIYGETKTGVSIMKMVKKMDAGDYCLQKEVAIDISDTAATLHDKLIKLSREMILDCLPKAFKQELEFTKQDEANVTFAYNISKEEEFVSFRKDYMDVYNHIRGLITWPLGYGIIDGEKIKLHSVSLSELTTPEEDGAVLGIIDNALAIAVKGRVLLLSQLQLAGKKSMTAVEFFNGYGSKLVNKKFE